MDSQEFDTLTSTQERLMKEMNSYLQEISFNDNDDETCCSAQTKKADNHSDETTSSTTAIGSGPISAEDFIMREREKRRNQSPYIGKFNAVPSISETAPYETDDGVDQYNVAREEEYQYYNNNTCDSVQQQSPGSQFDDDSLVAMANRMDTASIVSDYSSLKSGMSPLSSIAKKIGGDRSKSREWKKQERGRIESNQKQQGSNNDDSMTGFGINSKANNDNNMPHRRMIVEENGIPNNDPPYNGSRDHQQQHQKQSHLGVRGKNPQRRVSDPSISTSAEENAWVVDKHVVDKSSRRRSNSRSRRRSRSTGRKSSRSKSRRRSSSKPRSSSRARSKSRHRSSSRRRKKKESHKKKRHHKKQHLHENYEDSMRGIGMNTRVPTAPQADIDGRPRRHNKSVDEIPTHQSSRSRGYHRSHRDSSENNDTDDDNSTYDSDDHTQIFYESTDDDEDGFDSFTEDELPAVGTSVSDAVKDLNNNRTVTKVKNLFGFGEKKNSAEF